MEDRGRGRGRGRGQGRGRSNVPPNQGRSNVRNDRYERRDERPGQNYPSEERPYHRQDRNTNQGRGNNPQNAPSSGNGSINAATRDCSTRCSNDDATKKESLATKSAEKPLKPPVEEMFKLRISGVPSQPHASTGLKIPVRQDLSRGGTEGKPIKVLTNMLEIKFGKKFPDLIYHYNVEITPERKKYLYRKVFKKATENICNDCIIPFDGRRNAYSSKRLKITNDEKTVSVTVPDFDNNQTEYEVKISLVNELDATWLNNYQTGIDLDKAEITCLQALNIILNNAPATNSTQVRQSFFKQPTETPKYLGSGLELWQGLFQAAVIGWKPYLNVDVSHKGFFKEQPLMELIRTICIEKQASGGRRNQQEQSNPALTPQMIKSNKDEIMYTIRNLRVSIVVDGIKERSKQIVRGLTDKTPDQDFFSMGKDNHHISVAQYYATKKDYRIRRLDLPCVILQNEAHVPLEVCIIEPDQTTEKPKIIEKIARNMIRETAVGTAERQKKIHDVLTPVQHNSDPCVKDFDLKVDDKFAQVDARVLNPPTIYYKNDAPSQVKKGVWQIQEFRNTKLHINPKGTWTILCIDKNYIKEEKVYEFAYNFQRSANKLGFLISEVKSIEKLPRLDYLPFKRYLEKQKNDGVRFVIIIFDDRDAEAYPTIKQVAELEVGILTQCIKLNTFVNKLQKNDWATVNNILQKVNAKLNGVSHSFMTQTSRPASLHEKVMIVGIDVTHPSPQQTEIPSVAAVVSSHDPADQFKYNWEIRLQPPKKEIIIDLEEIMKNQLRYFFNAAKSWPEKIIVYRDGVSEGQFREVMFSEVTAIQRACAAVAPNNSCNPKITFIVVQKRHHIRLFPTRQQDSDDRNFNLKAGTVVDTQITHPTHIDFLLLSHASIQGTARPTKYRCLYDDSCLSVDEMEKITYYLCHVFPRCNRSVSYPAPTYLAHLAAARARNLIKNAPINLNDLDNEQKKLNLQADMKKTPMFFV